jgi:hypothetical protein
MKPQKVLIILVAALMAPMLAEAQPCGQGGGMHGRVCMFDSNRDCNTTLEEVKTTRAKIFQTADRNSDGQLTSDELDMVRQARRTQRMLTRHDSNDDGKISLEEFNNQMPLWFSRLDNNGDGIVTAREKQNLRGVACRRGGERGSCGRGRGGRSAGGYGPMHGGYGPMGGWGRY